MCRAEIAEREALTGRGAGQPWHEQVEEQEEFNTDPMDQGGSHEDQHPHRYYYDYEYYASRKGEDSNPEEEEQEGDTE